VVTTVATTKAVDLTIPLGAVENRKESDDSDGAQQRKKDALTQDYLDTVRKTLLLANLTELMAAFV